MTPTPIVFIWDGEAMLPVNTTQSTLCDELFIIGQRYRLVEVHDRSARTHNYYYACLTEAWENLPENLTDRFPSVDHLRKYALIKCGFFDSRTVVVDNPTQARRVAKFVAPLDEFSIVIPREGTVTIYTAKSQSFKAMGKVEFAKSKEAVLAFVSGLIESDPKTLKANTGVSA